MSKYESRVLYAMLGCYAVPISDDIYDFLFYISVPIVWAAILTLIEKGNDGL